MDDLSRRIRKANPYADRPLPDHAVKTLDDLLSGRRTARWGQSSVMPEQPRRSRFSFAAASGVSVAVAAFAVLILVVVLWPQTAVAATPTPLPVQATTWTVETLREDLMRGTPSSGVTASRRGAEWEGWFLQLDADKPALTFIQPQRTVVEWRADRSGTSRVIAGVPLTAGGVPIEPAPDSASMPGTVLFEDVWEQGELEVPFPTTPPNQTAAMRAYLNAYLSKQGITQDPQPSAGEYVFAINSLMQVWTLSDAAERAAINVVLDASGVSVAGATTDRAGRSGTLLAVEPTDLQPGYHVQLVVDVRAWRLLAVETTTIEGLPDFDVPPGSVTDYTLWR